MLGFLHRQKKPSRRNQFIHSTQKEARLQMDRYTDGHTDGHRGPVEGGETSDRMRAIWR